MGVVFHPSGRQTLVPTEIFWILTLFQKEQGEEKFQSVVQSTSVVVGAGVRLLI